MQSARHAVYKIAVDGAELELPGLRPFQQPRVFLKQRAQLARRKVGRKRQAGDIMNVLRAGRERATRRLAPHILPYDGGAYRLAGDAVPHDGGFPLVGERNRGDPFFFQPLAHLGNDGFHIAPYLLRVMLRPSGRGIVLPVRP